MVTVLENYPPVYEHRQCLLRLFCDIPGGDVGISILVCCSILFRGILQHKIIAYIAIVRVSVYNSVELETEGMGKRWNICQHLKLQKNGEYQRDEYRYFVVKDVSPVFQSLAICG